MTSSNVSFFIVTSVYHDHRKQFDWIFPISCNVLFLVAGIWILSSLVHYGIKTKQWKLHVSRRDSDKLNAGKIYFSVIVCAVLCDIHLAFTLLYTNLEFELNQDRHCEYSGDTINSLYGLFRLSVQIFFWLRQRIFYTNQMLNVNYSTPVKVISLSSIIVLLMVSAAFAIFFIYPDNFKSSINGCSFASDLAVEYAVILLVATWMSQITLISLFVYALRQSSKYKPRRLKHYSSFLARINAYCLCCKQPAVESQPENIDKRVSSIDAASCINAISTNISTISPASPVTPSLQNAPSNKAVRMIIQKTIVFDFISFIADVVTHVVVIFALSPANHRRYSLLTGNINILLNLLFVTFSFASHRKMLTSPCRSFK